MHMDSSGIAIAEILEQEYEQEELENKEGLRKFRLKRRDNKKENKPMRGGVRDNYEGE